MEDVQGSCDKRFGAVQEVLARQLASGADLGASVAVTIEGEFVVDVWGGWADAQQTRPWAENTITNVWSTTKTMTALAALVLVERGELNLDAAVADYWPEFAANGKERIEVRHVMSHTSGVSGWDQPVTSEDIYDWDKSTEMLAAQAPWWEPGTASGYHMLNYGHLVGEVIRRITGRKLSQFFADEIAGPLGADFSIGVRLEDDDRVSPIVPMPDVPLDFAGLDPNSPAIKTFTGPAMEVTAALTESWRRADIGAANGHGNARSVARIQAVVANRGTVDGVNLLSPTTVERIFDQQSDGIDLVARHSVAVRDRLRPAPTSHVPLHPRRTRLLLGRSWRLDDHYRPRSSHDDRLHDEQNGRGRRGQSRARKPSSPRPTSPSRPRSPLDRPGRRSRHFLRRHCRAAEKPGEWRKKHVHETRQAS